MGALTALLLLSSGPVVAEGVVGTLALDGSSVIAFSDQQSLPIPSGSSVRFHFGDPQADGKVPFTIAAADVQIAPIPFLGSTDLEYTLASATTGTLEQTGSGIAVRFSTNISVTLGPGNAASSAAIYPAYFTTEQTIALNSERNILLAIQGQRLSETAKTLRLVAGATNRTDGVMAPGEAVSAVLSGTFDQLPSFAP